MTIDDRDTQLWKASYPIVITELGMLTEESFEQSLRDGISGENFAKELNNACHISGSMEDVAKYIYPTLKEGDILVGLGAGTITELGKYLLKLDK